MRRKNFFIKFIVGALAAASLLIVATDLWAARNLAPILPLSYRTTGTLPLLAESLRDPSLSRKVPTDSLYADHLVTRIAEIKSDLRFAKKLRRTELLRELYTSCLALSYYLEDAINGKKATFSKNYNSNSKLKQLRIKVVKHGLAYAKRTKNKSRKFKALYHVLATKYLLGYNRTKIDRQLKKVSKKLPNSLKRRAKLITAMLGLNRNQFKKSTKTLRSIASSLNREGRIASRLLLAKSLAGLNRKFGRAKGSNKAYRNYLRSATKRASRLTDKQKSQVFSYALKVWIRAEGRNIDWARPPIYVKNFQNSRTQIFAINERSAIGDYKKSNLNRAIRKYQRLTKNYEGHPIAIKIDRRIADFKYLKFKKDKNVYSYTAFLIQQAAKYKNTNGAWANNQALAKKAHDEFNGRHRRIVYLFLKNAKKAKAKRAQRTKAIKIAKTYLKTTDSPKEQEFIKASLATIYIKRKQPKVAVRLYKELITSLASDPARKRKYLLLAIYHQSDIAGWPKKAPWQGIKRRRLADRKELLNLYGQLLADNGNRLDWAAIAHVGLLKINIGQPQGVFAMFLEALEQQPRGKHAQNAVGLMLVTYKKTKNWQALEDLSRFCLAHRLIPVSGPKRLNANAFLADALFHGGNQAYTAKQYKIAIEKLTEFINTFRNEKRRDHAYFNLAASLRGNGEYARSIDALKTLVDIYPKSSYYKRSLILGGEWSMEVAFEDLTMFFYQKFVDKYKNAKELQAIREDLVDLYIGRELYGNAGRIYLRLCEDKKRKDRSAYCAKYLDIEDRYGDIANAKKAAQYILKMNKTANDVDLAEALGFLARMNQEQTNLNQLAQIEQKLSRLDLGVREVREHASEVKYYIALKYSQITREKIFNLGLKNPKATLEKHYGLFLKVKAKFEAVCQLEDSSFCAPAMYKLARVTTNTIQTIEDISMPESIAEKDTQSFNSSKQRIIAALQSVAAKSDQKALQLVERGGTTSHWAGQILWSHTTDGKVLSVGGENSNDYIQWDM